MAAATIEPPKQSDQSKGNRAAVESWMTSLQADTTPPVTFATKPVPTPETEPPPTPAQPTSPKAPEQPTPEPKKTADTPPNEPADQGEDKWPRSSADWKKFITVRNENYKKRDERIKELETKLTEQEKALKGLPADPATFETLKQERERYEKEAKDLSERLRLAAIESHPKFKAYYDGKVNAQVELAKRVVGPEKADAIAEALKMPEGAWKTARLEELSADLSHVQASRLGSVLNSIEAIESERKSEVDRAKTDYEAAQAKATAEQTAAKERMTSEANARFEAVVKQAGDPKEGIALFQLRDGDEAWNKAVKARIDGARATLFGGNGTSPDNMIRKALLAEAFPPLLESYNTMLTELGALKAQVDKLTKASPTIEARTGGGVNGSASREPAKPGSRPMDVARDWMHGLQQASQG